MADLRQRKATESTDVPADQPELVRRARRNPRRNLQVDDTPLLLVAPLVVLTHVIVVSPL